MIVEGYVLHVYCENTDKDLDRHMLDHYVDYRHFEEFGGRNKREAYQEAKRGGWHLRARKAFCPGCALKRRTKS